MPGGKIAFVYQNNQRNESIILASKNRYIYLDNWWKRLHIFRKSSFLDLEPSTMIQTSCNFSPLLMFELGSTHRCLAFPGQINRWKWLLWYGLGSIITISACDYCSSTPQGLFRVFRVRFSLSVSRASCGMQISQETVSNAHLHQLTVSLFKNDCVNIVQGSFHVVLYLLCIYSYIYNFASLLF